MVVSYPLAKRITLSGSWTYYTGNAVSLPTGRTIGIDAPGSLDASTFFTLAPHIPNAAITGCPVITGWILAWYIN